MSPLAHCVKMPQDCFCIFSLLLRCFYKTWNKTWLRFVCTEIQSHLLFALQRCLKYNFNFILVVCKRGSPIKEMKRKSLNGTFHEEPHNTKAACVWTQKVRDAEPYCACQLGFCIQGKENKIYKDATLWSATCTAGEPRKETKTAIQSNWRTAIV